MQALSMQRAAGAYFGAKRSAPARPVLKVCAAGNGTCSDIDAINKAIGSKMKAAAVSMQSGKAKVDRENAQVGKYVAKAGAKAAVGKLHMRGMKPATPAPVAPKAAPAAAH